MRHALIRALVASAVASLLVPAAAPAQSGAGVEVTVTDTDGRPLSEVLVRWDAGDPYETAWGWTGEDGKIVIFGSGEFAVRFEPADGVAIQWLGGTPGRTASRTIVLRDGNWLDPIRVELPEGGAVSGTVKLDNATPVAFGCALVRTPAGDLVTRGWSGPDGRYTTRRVLAPGEYVVEFQHCASPDTWGWHGGTTLADARRVTVAAGRVTTGVDAVLDPTSRPADADGRPTTDPEVAAQVAQLNLWRRQMGVPALTFDPVMTEANRLHARYALHNPGAGHDEQPDNRWFTVEGLMGARSSGLDSVLGLASAPFHWFQMSSPWTTVVAPGGFVGGDGRVAAGLHTRHWPPETRPDQPTVDWPVRWPAPNMVAPGRSHFGEVPRPAAGCPGYLEDAQSPQFTGWGFPALIQFDHYGDPVEVGAHAVVVDGSPVESCAYTGGTFHDPAHPEYDDLTNGNLRTFNAVVVLPRRPLPAWSMVEIVLETNYGHVAWEFETPADPVTLGPGLTIVPGEIGALAQQSTPRAAAIALSERLFGRYPSGYVESPYAVVLCREDLFADCLAVAPLLDSRIALLFTAAGADAPLPPEVRAEIDRLEALDSSASPTIVAVGGPSAVSQRQLDEVAAAGFDVDRLSGPGRVETAAAVAENVASFGPERALLARADDWADAITGGAYAASSASPILLTGTQELHPTTAAWLAEWPGLEVVIVGGSSAVSPAVEEEVRRRGHRVRRVAGGNRIETSVAIARQLWARETTGIGDGYGFVDTFDPDGWQAALLGASVATRAPMPVLVAGPTVSDPVRDYLESASGVPGFGFVLGERAAAATDDLAALVDGCPARSDRPSCS